MAKEKKLKTKIESTRVVIVGAGAVGSSIAFALTIQGIVSEIVLIDKNKNKAAGEAKDLEQGLSFVSPTKIWAGDFKDCREADLVVITAGLPQKSGQSRLALNQTNSKIIKEVVKNITKQTKTAIILVVSNPLDVMTYVATKTAKLKPGQVLGSGTILDSSRFRFYLARQTKLDAESVNAYLIGEHGDSSVPIYSSANIMGQPITKVAGYNKKMLKKAYQLTKNAAQEVISKKGATYYAIALAACRLIRAIIYNENHVFPVATFLNGQYGLHDVCLSVPAIIGRTGVKKILELKLTAEETNQLKKSAQIIKQSLAEIR